MDAATKDIEAAAIEAAVMLKCLSNQHRLMILCLLNENEMSVGEINRFIDLEPSPVSQHLARLRSDGLVKTRKEAQTVFYSIADPKVREIINTLYQLYCA